MQHVAQALAALSKAERPVIVAGGGVMPLRRAGRAGRARREALHPGRDLAQRQGGDRRGSSAGGRRAGRLFARLRQPRARRSRPRLLHRQPRGRPGHQQLDVPAASAPRSSSSTSIRRSWAGTIPTPCRSWATPRSRCGAMIEAAPARTDAAAGWPQRVRQARRRMARRARADAQFGCHADPARAHLQGDLRRAAARRRRRLRHRPRRHLDRRA